MGPDRNRKFLTVIVKDIEENRASLTQASRGQYIAILIQCVDGQPAKLSRGDIKNGIFLFGLKD